jgi:signal transduction histidine kinase
MAFCVLVLALIGEIPPRNVQITDLALLLFALVAACYALDRWRPEIGRWVIVSVLNVCLMVGIFSLNVPESMILLCFPVAIAAALLGMPSASIVAVAETALIVVLRRQALVAEAPRVAPLAVGAVWGMFALMVGIYRPVRQLAKDSIDYYERAKDSLEEARNRRGELNAALHDLELVTRELLMTNQQLSCARLAAEEAQGAKAAFVARVSHELRTPLNMIVGFGEMITQAPQVYGGNLPQALLADLAVILRNSQHLSGLIDDVLDLSRVEAGKMAITREYTSLAQIIEDATIAVQPLFRSKGLHLKTDVVAEMPPIFCDRTRIREVIVNVLSNAGRFTEYGGVTVSAWPERGNVTVSVADSGPGIDPKQLASLFKPFAQLDDPLRRRHGGTGLGLSISKSLVELHNGKMWVESSVGVGTTVYFCLPLNPDTPTKGGPLRCGSTERCRRAPPYRRLTSDCDWSFKSQAMC